MPTIALLLLSAVAAAPAPGTLVGRVTDEAGAPIAGAVVDLYTARPRIGLPTTCPSCYRDCAKSTQTDADGRFSIDRLDPILMFRVLVMAAERRAVVTKLVDPAAAELEVELEPVPSGLPDERMLRGKVVDEQGQPLAGALLWPTGAKTRERRWWGALPGVDEAAVADAEGRFVITSQEPKLALDVQASAPGYATSPAKLFDLDGSEHEIRLRRGASVSGRLKYQGKPAAQRAIGIVQRDRSAGRFLGETTLATDGEGGFMFVDLQPNERYVLYSLCDGQHDAPVLKTVSVQTDGESEVTQLGELSLVEGLTLSGHVELPAGARLPEGAKVRASRDPAWDWCETPLDDQGAFTLRGLPAEVYSVSVIVPGFAIDSSRLRYQSTGESEFGLRLRGKGDSRLVYVAVPLKAK
ncbi:MAG TPA: carboxypeptidase-like regulatory domain-containing protein [Pirellulales bacterium]|nr:carboxypeptidase-like regulatory domain-containing protein [Pirellulales bacterium]